MPDPAAARALLPWLPCSPPQPAQVGTWPRAALPCSPQAGQTPAPRCVGLLSACDKNHREEPAFFFFFVTALILFLFYVYIFLSIAVRGKNNPNDRQSEESSPSSKQKVFPLSWNQAMTRGQIIILTLLAGAWKKSTRITQVCCVLSGIRAPCSAACMPALIFGCKFGSLDGNAACECQPGERLAWHQQRPAASTATWLLANM